MAENIRIQLLEKKKKKNRERKKRGIGKLQVLLSVTNIRWWKNMQKECDVNVREKQMRDGYLVVVGS